jgi:uncharacterized repeat protein (TIGR03803 family)
LIFGEVIFGPDGGLYGSTWEGGAFGWGAVYQLTPNSAGTWTEKVLHSFFYQRNSEPRSGVIFDKAGNLYGTTTGWQNSNCCGVVYEMMPQPNGSWQYKILHSFNWNDPAGFSPAATLVFDNAGNLYGTTSSAPSVVPLEAYRCQSIYDFKVLKA